jgi:hypothetical protein
VAGSEAPNDNDEYSLDVLPYEEVSPTISSQGAGSSGRQACLAGMAFRGVVRQRLFGSLRAAVSPRGRPIFQAFARPSIPKTIDWMQSVRRKNKLELG